MKKIKRLFFVTVILFSACDVATPPEPKHHYYYVNMVISETAYQMIEELYSNNALTASEAYRIVNKYPYLYSDGSDALSNAITLETENWTDISDEILSLNIGYEVISYFEFNKTAYDSVSGKWRGLVCYYYMAVSDLHRIIFLDSYKDGEFFQ